MSICRKDGVIAGFLDYFYTCGNIPSIATVIINNHLPPGDSLIGLNIDGLKTGAGSTVIGAFILNALLTEVIERLAQTGEVPPIFISANIPGAQAHNEQLFERYRIRNPHL